MQYRFGWAALLPNHSLPAQAAGQGSGPGQLGAKMRRGPGRAAQLETVRREESRPINPLSILGRAFRLLPMLAISGCALGFAGSQIATAGCFCPWKLVGLPPSPAQEIVHIGALNLIVEAEDGSLYSHEIGASPSTWTSVHRGDDSKFSYPFHTQDCPQVSPPRLSNIRTQIDACAAYGDITLTSRFAVLEDGSVWSWRQPISRDLEFSVLGVLLVSSIGLIAALVLGVIAKSRPTHGFTQ
jgi:hypothetical protein